MNVLIVVESCFSNTHGFAQAVAAGLTQSRAVVTVVEAASRQWDSMPVELSLVDLLVLGAPVHHRGLPNRLSRALATTQGAAPKAYGVGEWLDGMPEWENGRAVAFDCGTGNTFIHGSAVNGIAKRLLRRGIEVEASERFLVEATEGPAAPGELDRAREWGAQLVPAASFEEEPARTGEFWTLRSPKGGGS